MLIGKRISFSLDGVWTEWGFRLQIANGGTPLYLNAHERVNTILTHFLRLAPPCAMGRCEATAQRDAAAWTLGQRPIAHLTPIAKFLAPARVATSSAAVSAEAGASVYVVVAVRS